jgi:hypothetical protein
MTYQSNLVASVKANHKIVKEHRTPGQVAVYLPFGTEYSILFKNLHARKASVKVSIDGTDVLYGKSLLIEPNKELELKRFLNELNKGNKFKFIEKTEEISDHRGDKIDDGIIRIEYQFEAPVPVFVNPAWWTTTFGGGGTIYRQSSITRNTLYSANVGSAVSSSSDAMRSAASMNVAPMSMNFCNTTVSSVPDGITVQGSVSNQQFQQGYIGALESQVHVINIVLKGRATLEEEIQKVIYSRDKIQCPTCGHWNKSSFKFCPQCTTAVHII